jgi:hypothetical protein
MKNVLLKIVPVLLIGFAPFALSEESVNLDRVTLSHVQIEGGDATGESLGFTSSFGENQQWVFGASATWADAEEDGIGASSDQYQLGFGYATYGENSATILSIGGGNADTDVCISGFGCGSDSSSFIFTGLDYIYNATDAIELKVGLTALNFTGSDVDSSTSVILDIGANFYVSDNVAFTLEFGADDDDTTAASIGLLYRF